MTGHPDHRAVSRWVTLAWEATGRRARLWYATLTPEFHQEWGALNADVGLWFDWSAPPSDPEANLAGWCGATASWVIASSLRWPLTRRRPAA